jgi:hypothetical protein
MPRVASVQLNFDLIQSIRLVQALTESAFSIHIPHEHTWRFASLREHFQIGFSRTAGPLLTEPHVLVDHHTPVTAVGGIRRPLIFPHQIVAACRNRWADERTIYASFSGLVTVERQAAIRTWLRQRTVRPRRLRIPISTTRTHRAVEAIRSAAGLRNKRAFRIRGGDFVMSSSCLGRRFPTKAWDDTYVDTLGRSRFALCPNGDSVWTYRFFEATMCGAVPIVEQSCELYEGFHYYTMADHDYVWSIEKAEHNYQLCAQQLTVPKADLNDELTRLTTAKEEPTESPV